MRHRVRAACLWVRVEAGREEILLVGHHSKSRPGFDWWLPPGGGLEDEDESIFACARREALEEAGVTVEVSRIAYVQEFINGADQIRHVAFYMPVDRVEGTIGLHCLPADATDAPYIFEVRWVAREELSGLTVYPEYLQSDGFWEDVAAGFPGLKYLNVMTKM